MRPRTLPGTRLTASRESRRFEVDTTPPRIENLTAAVEGGRRFTCASAPKMDSRPSSAPSIPWMPATGSMWNPSDNSPIRKRRLRLQSPLRTRQRCRIRTRSRGAHLRQVRQHGRRENGVEKDEVQTSVAGPLHRPWNRDMSQRPLSVRLVSRDNVIVCAAPGQARTSPPFLLLLRSFALALVLTACSGVSHPARKWWRHRRMAVTAAPAVELAAAILPAMSCLSGKAAASTDSFPSPAAVFGTPISLPRPVDPNSSTIMSNWVGSVNVHPDWGNDPTYGIPYVVVDGNQSLVNVNLGAYGDESDPGPMPVPANAPFEGGSSSTGDRHVLVLDNGNCFLYELYNSSVNSDGTWNADSTAVWDLLSDQQRPYTWTSADAAGLPVFPGLVRYDEVASGKIQHAFRFTLPQPARHLLLQHRIGPRLPAIPSRRPWACACA